MKSFNQISRSSPTEYVSHSLQRRSDKICDKSVELSVEKWWKRHQGFLRRASTAAESEENTIAPSYATYYYFLFEEVTVGRNKDSVSIKYYLCMWFISQLEWFIQCLENAQQLTWRNHTTYLWRFYWNFCNLFILKLK